MAKKATRAEVEARVNEVFTLIIAGASRQDILRYAVKQGLSERSGDDYIRRANDRLEELASIRRDRELGLAISRLNTLYRNCIQASDNRGALAVVKEISTLLGLHAPSKIHHVEAVTWADFIRQADEDQTDHE